MTEPRRGGCLQSCCSFIFTLGFTALSVWLYLRVSNPSFSIEAFSVKPAASAAGATNLTFLLKLNNPNLVKGIYYDDVNLAFYLVNGPDRARDAPVGNYTVPGFYQGHKKRARKTGSFETRRVNLTDLTAGNGTAFRVDLETDVRFKILAWKTKRHRQRVGADIAVNATGDKPESMKGVRLTSGSGGSRGGCSFQIGVLVHSFIFVLLNLGSRI